MSTSRESSREGDDSHPSKASHYWGRDDWKNHEPIPYQRMVDWRESGHEHAAGEPVDWLRYTHEELQKEKHTGATEASQLELPRNIAEAKEQVAAVEKQIATLEEQQEKQQVKPQVELMSTYLGQISASLEHKIGIVKWNEKKIEELNSQIEQKDTELKNLQGEFDYDKRHELDREKMDLTGELNSLSRQLTKPINNMDKLVEWNTKLCNQRDALDQKLAQFESLGEQEEWQQVSREIHQLVSQANKMIEEMNRSGVKVGASKRSLHKEGDQLQNEISRLIDLRNTLHQHITYLESESDESK